MNEAAKLSSEIAKVGELSAEAYQQVQADFVGIEPTFAIPFVSIRQKPELSDDGRTVIRAPGRWRFNDNREDDLEVFRCVMLACNKGRTHFDPNSNQPDCRSLDGSTPLQPKFARTCATCPLSQWVGTDKPECPEQLNLLLLDATLQPFIYSASGSHLKPVKAFLNALIHLERRAPTDFVVNIGVEKTEKPPYTWYLPVFPSVEDIKSSLEPGSTVKSIAPIGNAELRTKVLQLKEELAPILLRTLREDSDGGRGGALAAVSELLPPAAAGSSMGSPVAASATGTTGGRPDPFKELGDIL